MWGGEQWWLAWEAGKSSIRGTQQVALYPGDSFGLEMARSEQS